MTEQQPNSDRLDRLENLAGSILTALDQLRLRQEVTQQQVDSNARAIESNSGAISDLTHQVDELREISQAQIQALETAVDDLHSWLRGQFGGNGHTD